MSKRRRITLACQVADAARQVGPRPLAAMAVAATAVAVVRGRVRLGLPRSVCTACAYAVPPALAAGFRRSLLRDGMVWGAQMWAYENAFEMPNDDSHRLRERAHFDYPIAVDARLGHGMPLGQRLQRRLRQSGQLSWLDKGLTFVYWTWEAEPHLVLAWLRCKQPERFPAAAGRLAATFNLTLFGYWALPTAPPWWAAEKLGRMDGDVRRVVVEVASWLKREPNPTEGDHELGANPFAAMPSDHFATAAMAALLLSEEGWGPGAAGWCYALVLGFALVYLGEHYVTDELAGLALALAVSRCRDPLERFATAVFDLGPRSPRRRARQRDARLRARR